MSISGRSGIRWLCVGQVWQLRVQINLSLCRWKKVLPRDMLVGLWKCSFLSQAWGLQWCPLNSKSNMFLPGDFFELSSSRFWVNSPPSTSVHSNLAWFESACSQLPHNWKKIQECLFFTMETKTLNLCHLCYIVTAVQERTDPLMNSERFQQIDLWLVGVVTMQIRDANTCPAV